MKVHVTVIIILLGSISFTKQEFISCELECRTGKLIEKAEKNPDINGCGSYSIQVKFDKFNLTDFDKCCNEHDICYEYCNTTKSECDQRFDSCLQEVCFEKKIERDWGFLMSKACLFMVDVMVASVELFGCLAFKRGQENSCFCL